MHYEPPFSLSQHWLSPHFHAFITARTRSSTTPRTTAACSIGFCWSNFPLIILTGLKWIASGIPFYVVVSHLNPTRTWTWRPQNKNRIDLDSESGAHGPIRHTFPALCTRDTLGETLRSCRLYASYVDRSVITLRILIKRMGQADGNRRLYGVSLDYDTTGLINQLFLGKGSIYNRAAVRIPFQFASSSEFVKRCLESIRNIFSNIWSEKVTLIVHFKWTVDQFEQLCCVIKCKKV